MGMDEVRRRLKEIKAERGWTAKSIAAQTNEDETRVQRWLSGEVQHVPAHWIAEFSRVAGVRLDWVLLGEEPRTPVAPAVTDLAFQLMGEVIDLSRKSTVSSRALEGLLAEVLALLREEDPDRPRSP